MQNEKLITVQLTVDQAEEAMGACISRRDKLDKDRQYLLTQGRATAEIARNGKRIVHLHRAECALRKAIESSAGQPTFKQEGEFQQ